MSISEAMEQTIKEGIERGVIDPVLHAGPIECVRSLAARADVASDNDPNTFPVLLKYLAGLNLVDSAKPGRPRTIQPAEPEQGKLDAARSGRYKKFHAA